MADVPSLPTRVGHAGDGYQSFFGYHVGKDLVGRLGYWSAISMAVGGQRLSDEDAALLEQMSTALLGPDPRIWPWKLTRLMSAYGRFTTGLAAPLVATSGARIGPPALGMAAQFLCGLSDALGSRHDDDEALSEVLDARLAVDARPPGWGTPFRKHDERLQPIVDLVARRERDGGHYWQLFSRASERILAKHKLPVNAAAAVSAVCLDLGFRPPQIEAFGTLLLMTNSVANAYEGAQQAPEVLQELPESCVRYAGPPPRTSPRADKDS
jgi:hypothetical protein